MSDFFKKRLKIKESPLITKYLLSSLIGLIISLVGLSVLTVLLLTGMKINGSTKIFIYIIVGLGGFISGFFAHKKIKGRGIVNGLISSLVYASLLLLFICIAMSFKISVGLFIIVPIVIACGCVGGILEANM